MTAVEEVEGAAAEVVAAEATVVGAEAVAAVTHDLGIGRAKAATTPTSHGAIRATAVRRRNPLVREEAEEEVTAEEATVVAATARPVDTAGPEEVTVGPATVAAVAAEVDMAHPAATAAVVDLDTAEAVAEDPTEAEIASGRPVTEAEAAAVIATKRAIFCRT